jgi:predicted NACHT family NTPase
MTAESIKPKPKRLTKTTTKQKQILKEFTEHPQASMRQLAKYAGASVSTVHEVLQRYGITKNYVEDYKENRADIFAGLQSRLISSISEQDIQKAPMGSRVLAAAQLYDKERIERGLSNGDQPIMVIIRDKPQPVQVEGKVVDIPKVEQDSLLITPES